ncbi:MAG: PKD domain-containing protein [Armatimonadota bacterium]|nr:PKD domain-containing protein [Armatimonadota bacterium]
MISTQDTPHTGFGHTLPRTVCVSVCLLSLLIAANPVAAVPAFPGAEGFGAEATGGRGGQVVEVTRLDDPVPGEPGTLRYALEEVSGPRIIVFRVGGVIELNEPLLNSSRKNWGPYESDITIAGQTAPGDGIVIKGGLAVRSNCIIRYLRIRQGEVGMGDCLEMKGYNNIVDHCSFSWAGDELVGYHRTLPKDSIDPVPARHVTVQWCVLSESMKALLAWYAHQSSIHHNLFAHNGMRNPVFQDRFNQGGGDVSVGDIRSNVVYDVQNDGCALLGNVHVNIVGNYWKVGKTSRLHRYCVCLRPAEMLRLYIDDIYGPRVAQGEPIWHEVRDGWDIADENMYRSLVPFDTPPVTTHDPQTTYDLVLGNAGATVPVRDVVDTRIVAEVRDGTNRGGYPTGQNSQRAMAAANWATLTYENGTPPDDSDHDGMPDSWETEHGLDPNDESDGPRYDLDPDYTNVEVYLNSLVPEGPPGNHQPTADAGSDQEVSAGSSAEAEVELDGSGSSDADGDPLTYRWTWQDAEGNDHEASGVNPTVSLPSGETVVTLVVNDGSLNSVPDTVTITVNSDNSPPPAPEVSISPDAPTTSDDLVVTAESTDPDGDDVTFTYAWYKNDELQDEVTGDTVSSDLTARDETWRVVVTPSDGSATGDAGEASVTIANSPPTAPTVSITPGSPTTLDDLVASVEGSTDSDDDTVTYEYAWYRDDTLQEDLTGDTVSSDLTGDGETWRVVVTPSDGTDAGETGEASVTIGKTYTVSGTVLYPNDEPVPGVGVTDGDQTALTDDQGQYTLTVVQTGELSISASKDSHVVTPQVQKVTVPPDATGVDFKAHQVFRHRLRKGISFVGVPCVPLQTDPTTVWGTELIARWNPEQHKYVFAADGSSDLLTVQPGRGFFLKSPARDLSVPGVPVSSGALFPLTIEHGWNMVANMFAAGLPFGNLMGNAPSHVHPYGFAYDADAGDYLLITSVAGANVDRNDIFPWEGIWMYNHGRRAKLEVSPPEDPIPPDPPQSADTAAASSSAVVPQSAVGGDRGWLVPIEVEAGGRCDTTTVVGTSSMLADPVEIYNPPTAPESVDMYIVGADGQQLAQCVRNSVGAASWEFVVSTDLCDAEVSVRLPDLSQVPNDMCVYLTDIDANKRVYARTMRRYRYVSGDSGGQRRFKLEVVPQDDASLVVTAMAASQGPEAVALQYNVSKQCDVSARVLNIAGRPIRVLARAESVMSGANTLSWNLRSDRGTKVANGRYIIQITARSADGQQTHAITTTTVRR